MEKEKTHASHTEHQDANTKVDHTMHNVKEKMEEGREKVEETKEKFKNFGNKHPFPFFWSRIPRYKSSFPITSWFKGFYGEDSSIFSYRHDHFIGATSISFNRLRWIFWWLGINELLLCR